MHSAPGRRVNFQQVDNETEPSRHGCNISSDTNGSESSENPSRYSSTSNLEDESVESLIARAKSAAAAAPADALDGWSAKGWVASLRGLDELVADSMVGPSATASAQLTFLRTLGESGRWHRQAQASGRAAVRALIDQSGMLERLIDVLWDGVLELAKPADAGRRLHEKFVQESGALQLSYDGLSLYFQGLSGLIGPPHPNLAEALHREHCEGPDARLEFTAPNYGTLTSSPIEYYFVADPAGGLARFGIDEYPRESRLLEAAPSAPESQSARAQCRVARPPADFQPERDLIDEALRESGQARPPLLLLLPQRPPLLFLSLLRENGPVCVHALGGASPQPHFHS